jgi:NAD(P)H-hydrate epimerase
VVAGTGDNGGDGFVAARYLLETKASVEIFLLGKEEDIKSERAKLNWERVKRLPRARVVTMANGDFWKSLSESLATAEVVVDAIFGTGLRGAVGEPYASAIDLINSSKAFRVAVDVPSGLDCDSGKILGKAVKADVTITFHRPKLGLLENPEFVGELLIVDIGIPLEADG